jgi:hypothetical protein
VTFVWSTFTKSSLYRVTVFDAEGTVLYRGDVSDSVLVLPDSIQLRAGQTYFWKVESDTGWNRRITSRLAQFSLSADSVR